MIQYAGFTGQITVTLLDAQKKEIASYTGKPDSDWSYVFDHVPKGTYYLNVSWSEYNKQFSLEKQIEVRK